MQFGLFGSAQARRGGPDLDSGAGFRDFVAYNIEAEAIGYHSTFLVEHHFTGFGQVSATLNLLTWIGARTTTLRLGTAVLVLPWHNPVLLAEQAATLDLLSGGRFDFGIGKGYRYNEFSGFCVPMEEAEARFDECVEVMTRAWTSETPWSHQGKYWQFKDVVVEPPTAQKPHPPIWMGAEHPDSIKKVAARGYNLLLGQFSSTEEIGERIAIFRQAVEASGRQFDPMTVGVARSLNIVMTKAEYEKAIENRMMGRRRTYSLADRETRTRSEAEIREAAEAGTLYGTPEDIAAKLQSLRAVGVEYVLLNSAGGLASLRRFAHEILPAFADTPRLRTAV
jgi:alkanesulfonate monooxygenase SsuD/methylene tetrahydromethanopterin reductase-like flavin-dependent oxidoreductase (luciferase family)